MKCQKNLDAYCFTIFLLIVSLSVDKGLQILIAWKPPIFDICNASEENNQEDYTMMNNTCFNLDTFAYDD